MSAAQTAYDFFTAQGLSPGAATGVVGNLVAESGLSTTIRGDGGKAVGIAQWHPDRWANLTAWAGRNRLDPYALTTQLQYTRLEAATATGGNVWGKLLGAKDAVTASALWMRLFERPADQSQAAAQRRAQAGVNALNGQDTGPASSSGSGAPDGTVQTVGSGLIGGVAGSVVSAVRPLLLEGVFLVMGVTIVGVGLTRLFPKAATAVGPTGATEKAGALL